MVELVFSVVSKVFRRGYKAGKSMRKLVVRGALGGWTRDGKLRITK